MDEKLKKIAIKIEGIVKYFGTVTDTYSSILNIATKQPDYFKFLGPENIIKLSLYVYSLKETKDFKLGEKMINNLSFINLIYTDNTPFQYTCKKCGGDGLITCRTCGGDIEIDCQICDGAGEIYTDEGNYDVCYTCHGDGRVECPGCNGRGDITCQECDGYGEIKSDDEIVYWVLSIVTWNKEIKDRCELKENISQPIMSDYEFDTFRDDVIVLYTKEEHGSLDIITDKMYCVGYYDEPKLNLTDKMVLTISEKINVSHLEK